MIADPSPTPEQRVIEKYESQERQGLIKQIFSSNKLSQEEQLAIGFAFEIDWLFNNNEISKEDLEVFFGTTDLVQYVHDTILPRLNDQSNMIE